MSETTAFVYLRSVDSRDRSRSLSVQLVSSSHACAARSLLPGSSQRTAAHEDRWPYRIQRTQPASWTTSLPPIGETRNGFPPDRGYIGQMGGWGPLGDAAPVWDPSTRSTATWSSPFIRGRSG